jgi:hypothetical protein
MSAMSEISVEFQRAGFLFMPAPTMQGLLERVGSLTDWPTFVDSWNDLALDTYLAEHGRYRRRRHAVYYANRASIERAPHEAHYQTLDYNALQGGIARWFEPIAADVGDGASMRCILTFCGELFGSLASGVTRWRIEAHQFRIEARPGEPGQPTPEGLHRDGVDYVLVLMIQRSNIASGTTTIHGLDKSLLGSFTLTDPFDAALVDDPRVFHGVTAVEPVDARREAHRDVLVVTFKRT